jgi:hypothetical protein
MEPEKQPQNDWITTKWRPMMAVQYMVVCLFDFIGAPILWSVIQLIGDGKLEMQWIPLTLQGAGFYHIAMGAVLGIAALTRGQEKIARLGTDYRNSDQYYRHRSEPYQPGNFDQRYSTPGRYQEDYVDRADWRDTGRFNRNSQGYQPDVFADQAPSYRNSGPQG